MSYPSAPSLLLLHIRAQNRLFWRVPIGAFFTLILPVIMLVLFVALFGNEPEDSVVGPITPAQFYTPALAVFSVSSATFTNIAINLSTRREDGILRRVRGTPLPPWIYMAGAVGSAVWIGLIALTVMVSLGVVAYDVNIELAKLPAMLLVFVVGAGCFATLGVGLAGMAKSASAASALANAAILPMAFISNIFINLGDEPAEWIQLLGDLLPLRHFGIAFAETMSPFSETPAIVWDRLGVLVLWAIVGALFARSRFRWDPAPGSTGRSSRRSGRRTSV
jgi:ABC-2 type transport system permease protein